MLLLHPIVATIFTYLFYVLVVWFDVIDATYDWTLYIYTCCAINFAVMLLYEITTRRAPTRTNYIVLLVYLLLTLPFIVSGETSAFLLYIPIICSLSTRYILLKYVILIAS